MTNLRLSFMLICVSLPLSIQAENTLSNQAISKWQAQLPSLRLQKSDLRIAKPTSLPFIIPQIDRFYADPLKVPTQSETWLRGVNAAQSSHELISLAEEILFEPPQPPARFKLPPIPPFPKEIPTALRPALIQIYAAQARAQLHLNKAVQSISEEARLGFLQLSEVNIENVPIIKQEISAQRIKKHHEGMNSFEQACLIHAGKIITQAVDDVLGKFKDQNSKFKTVRWGTYLIGGAGDNSYSETDIASATVIIDLGGNNSYDGPVAAARPGEIRLLIDWGQNITIESYSHQYGNAGSGLFGIGLIYLPNKNGIKILKTGSFAQGCGIAGIGGLFIRGQANLQGGRNVQGVASFGVGIVDVQDGDESEYSAVKYGQGAGFVRGIGIMRHRGHKTRIKGGLSQPDPREPLGAVSICQGVGFGRRAYSGGGLGIASIHGDDISVEGSYFAQGVGYWHALGIFQLKGNRNQTQARRYDQGSGVHYAFGHFQVEGNQNRILNWGVGPAYGWDNSAGFAIVHGDQNEFQTEWGVGTAAIGSLSFGWIHGNNNKLHFPNWGSGDFQYNLPSYAVQIYEGQNNWMQIGGMPLESPQDLVLTPNPWGRAIYKNITTSKDLKLTPPIWNELKRAADTKREMVNLQEIIQTSETQLHAKEKVARLVDVAAAFSLDKQSPRVAMQKLMELDAALSPHLIDILDPAAVDQMIYLRLAIISQANTLAPLIIEAINNHDLEFKKKLSLLGILGYFKPTVVFDDLFSKLNSGAIRERLTAAQALGKLFNQDSGKEPGSRFILDEIKKFLKSKRNKKELLRAMARLRVYDAYAVLNQSLLSTAGERAALLKSAPVDLTATLEEKGAKELLQIIQHQKKEAHQHLKQELMQLEIMEEKTRGRLVELLKSTTAAEVRGATIALGQIGHERDGATLAPLLKHDKAAVREAAAASLARLRMGGFPFLQEALLDTDIQTRDSALVSVRHGLIKQCQTLLEMGLRDPDKRIRQQAVTLINNLPPVLKNKRKKILQKAKKWLKGESDFDIRFALSLMR